MKIIVTGGAGFIGSHIVDALVSRGHKVTVIDNLSSGKKENINPKAKFYKADIRSKKIEEIFKKEKPECVYHQAAHLDIRASVRDPIFDAENNIIGSLNILENCAKYKVGKIIFASTGGAIYGDTNQIPTPETNPVNPVSPYGVTKLSVENYLHYYFEIFKLAFVALRYANVYGPRQSPHGEAGVIAIFTDKMLRDEQPIIFGSGRQTRDYIYIDDVVGANLLALRSKKIGVYNVGTGKETNVIYLFKKLKTMTGANVREVHGSPIGQKNKATVLALGEQKRSALECKKIHREMGWGPRVKLDEGLKKTVGWFKNKKDARAK